MLNDSNGFRHLSWAPASCLVGLGAIRGDRSVRPLDGMERFAARNVSIATAIAAMEARDLKKLQMLSVWVKNRDQTVLLSPNDLSALDFAIECLEHERTPDERKLLLERSRQVN